MATKEEIERVAWKRVVARMIELNLTPSIVRDALNRLDDLDEKPSYFRKCADCGFELEFHPDERPDLVLCVACATALSIPRKQTLEGVICQKCGDFFDPEVVAEHRCSVVCDYCNACGGNW